MAIALESEITDPFRDAGYIFMSVATLLGAASEGDVRAIDVLETLRAVMSKWAQDVEDDATP